MGVQAQDILAFNAMQEFVTAVGSDKVKVIAIIPNGFGTDEEQPERNFRQLISQYVKLSFCSSSEDPDFLCQMIVLNLYQSISFSHSLTLFYKL